MKILAAIGAFGLVASCLYAQGLNPAGQTKDDWEEINFEFNSSILSDGYPSMLRLADLLSQHQDYKVKVTGNTDYVGSARYNDKLAHGARGGGEGVSGEVRRIGQPDHHRRQRQEPLPKSITRPRKAAS